MSIVMIYRFALVALSALGLACHDAPDGVAIDCLGRSVRMGVASSLREVALSLRQELLARDEPIDVEMIYGASSAHARQLMLGAPMDLLVSADAAIAEELAARGLLVSDSVFEFARGRLVLVASANWNPPGPGVPKQGIPKLGIDALDAPELKRIAVPTAAVPLGRYVRQWLESEGRLDKLEGKIVTTEHARATLSAVDAGHVDLAIVYESDARLADRAVVLARIEPSEHPAIRYVAARVAAAPACPAIDEVLAAWAIPTTIARLVELGFLPAGPMDVL
jgi:molybdate transport system substrate-binding protein